MVDLARPTSSRSSRAPPSVVHLAQATGPGRRRATASATARWRGGCSTPPPRSAPSTSCCCRAPSSTARGPTTRCRSPRTRRCGRTPAWPSRRRRPSSSGPPPSGATTIRPPPSRSSGRRSPSRPRATAGSPERSRARRRPRHRRRAARAVPRRRRPGHRGRPGPPGRLDGPRNVAPDGWISGDTVRSLAGGRAPGAAAGAARPCAWRVSAGAGASRPPRPRCCRTPCTRGWSPTTGSRRDGWEPAGVQRGGLRRRPPGRPVGDAQPAPPPGAGARRRRALALARRRRGRRRRARSAAAAAPLTRDAARYDADRGRW